MNKITTQQRKGFTALWRNRSCPPFVSRPFIFHCIDLPPPTGRELQQLGVDVGKRYSPPQRTLGHPSSAGFIRILLPHSASPRIGRGDLLRPAIWNVLVLGRVHGSAVDFRDRDRHAAGFLDRSLQQRDGFAQDRVIGLGEAFIHHLFPGQPGSYVPPVVINLLLHQLR